METGQDQSRVGHGRNPFYVLRTEEQARKPTFHRLGLKAVTIPSWVSSSPPPTARAKTKLGFPSGKAGFIVGPTCRHSNRKAAPPKPPPAMPSPALTLPPRYCWPMISALASDIMSKTAEARGILDGVRDIAMKATKAEAVEELQEEYSR